MLDRIVIDPEICNGKPTVRGTRITVATVIEFLTAGDSIDDVLDAYPPLTREDIVACLEFARDFQPHATIKVRLKTTEEGGSQGPILNRPSHHRCVLLVNHEAFDCGFAFTDGVLHPGQTYDVPIILLRADIALPMLLPGTPVALWEGKEIATGHVVRRSMT